MPKTYKQFPGVVCERIRWINRKLEAAEKRREKLFAARDQALTNLHQTPDGQVNRRKEFESDFGVAVIELEEKRKETLFLRRSLAETIADPDQGELFETPELNMPDFTSDPTAREGRAAAGDEPDDKAFPFAPKAGAM